jgi:hypothetical protein
MAYEMKTKWTDADVGAFIEAVPDAQMREDAEEIRSMMEKVSGEPAYMWGPSIVGFGTYHYKYASGHQGDAPRLGFAPRKKEIVLYLTCDAERHRAQIDRIGKLRTGKGCIYLKRLADLDREALEQFTADSLAANKAQWPD